MKKRWVPDEKLSPEELRRRRCRRVERAVRQRERAAVAQWSAECCINWYPGGCGWVTCKTCGKPLEWKRNETVSEKWRARHEQAATSEVEPDVPDEGCDDWPMEEDEVSLGGVEEGCGVTPQEQIIAMFEDVAVPGHDQVQSARGGRIDETTRWVGRVAGPVEKPSDWLSRFSIPIVPVREDQLGHGVGAAFMHHGRGEELLRAEVWVPTGGDVNDPFYRWCVWHEVGHACDFVGVREDLAIHVPSGIYSTKHIEVLRQWQETIIKWTPCSDREYKTKPCELWAEVVACCLTEPAKCPVELWVAVEADLRAVFLPIAPMHPIFSEL